MSDYNAKPVPEGTLLDDLHPSRFLKVTDLTERWKVQSLTVTISRLAYEETVPSMSDLDENRKPKVKVQPVLYFKTKSGPEFPRGMLLGAAENIKNLKEATGGTTAGDVIGKRITLVIREHKKKPVLRIDPTPVKENGSEQPPEEKDEIAAYSDLCKQAGLDTETKNSILRDCGGDFGKAYDFVAEHYKEVLV